MEADLRSRWAKKSPAEIRVGLLKLEQAVEHYEEKAQLADSVEARSELMAKADRASAGIAPLRRILAEKDEDAALLSRLDGKTAGEIAAELESMKQKVEEALEEGHNNPQSMRRLSTATRHIELAQAAQAKAKANRNRRATIV